MSGSGSPSEVDPNRSSGVIVDILDELRAHEDLVALLGATDRIEVGMPSEASEPIGLLVQANYAGGQHRGQGNRLRWLVQASVVATSAWKDANGSLKMHRIMDAAAEVLETSKSPGLVPLGSAGGSPGQLEDGDRFVIASRWRYQRTIQNHTA